jgi:two-component sensor histidine kinase
VTLSWTVVEDTEPRLRLGWRERGGPPIAQPPARRGFGSRLLERGIGVELGGSVHLDFQPAGLEALIEVPLDPANTPAP